MKKLDTKVDKQTTKAYGYTSWSITFLLCLVFGIIGAIVGGWTGLGVGVVMVLMCSVISYAGIVPFGGIPLYIMFYNMFMDWLYSVVPQMGVFLAPDALPRVVLFWVFGILAGIACVIMSFVLVVIIIAGLAALLTR